MWTLDAAGLGLIPVSLKGEVKTLLPLIPTHTLIHIYIEACMGCRTADAVMNVNDCHLLLSDVTAHKVVEIVSSEYSEWNVHASPT